jgi:hypothetical protein
LNLHNRLLTSGFLQTAVSDAPRSEWQVISGIWRGASDTALAFLAKTSGLPTIHDLSKLAVVRRFSLDIKLAFAKEARTNRLV